MKKYLFSLISTAGKKSQKIARELNENLQNFRQAEAKVQDESTSLDPYAKMKVALVECDNCSFAVGFQHDNRTFFYCPIHKFGVNVPNEKLNTTQMCRPCDKPLERYDLYQEDNVCPMCRNLLSITYVPLSKP